MLRKWMVGVLVVLMLGVMAYSASAATGDPVITIVDKHWWPIDDQARPALKC
jgi:hypothetical protein